MTSESSSVNESSFPGTMQTRHHSGTVACHKATAYVAMCTMGRADAFSAGGLIMIPSRSENILKSSRGDIMLVEQSVLEQSLWSLKRTINGGGHSFVINV